MGAAAMNTKSYHVVDTSVFRFTFEGFLPNELGSLTRIECKAKNLRKGSKAFWLLITGLSLYDLGL